MTMRIATLLSSVLVVVVGCAGPSSGPDQPSAQAARPNILLVISDDQSYPHASAYSSAMVRTPGFDRVADQGVLFRRAFVSAPSCGPSRASLLTGQDFYRLRDASMNHTVWPDGLSTYVDVLEEAGYAVGFTGKGWAPGNWSVSGSPRNPAGHGFNDLSTTPPGEGISPVDYAENFRAFLDQKPEAAPFAFWVGFQEPHRPFEDGIGRRQGKDLSAMEVPAFLPDTEEVRSDLADYAFGIEHIDGHLARILDLLDERGEIDNTLIVVTSDNGMAFPRAKATLYDAGARVPLAVRWGDRVPGGRDVDDFVSFIDFAPTFLAAAGIPVPPDMTGRSLLPVLLSPESGRIDPDRSFAVFGLERHFPGARPDGAGYPMRAIRTEDHLYVRNLQPGNTPVGDRPGLAWPDGDPVGGFGDVDGGPSKTFLWNERRRFPDLAEKAFGPRPAEELYDVSRDAAQMNNLASDPAMDAVRRRLSLLLDEYLRATGDPRATGEGETLDAIMRRFPVVGSNR